LVIKVGYMFEEVHLHRLSTTLSC